MTDLLPDAIPVLPPWLLEGNLLRGFIWYISIAFVISLGLRLRFYRAVYLVARYVSDSCPNVYSLIREHWILCVRNGILPLVAVYVTIVLVYSTLNQLVWPLSSISLAQLAKPTPFLLVFNLVLIATMVTVDIMLIIQVGVINAERVQQDLEYAEQWLGGNLFAILQRLGKWNPIKRYADRKAQESLVWFNQIFRDSLRVVILETALRIVVAFVLFLSSVSEV